MTEARDLGLLTVENKAEPEAGQLAAVDRPKATARAITLNFITGGLGSAIFSLPWSVAGSSIISSVVIVGAVLLLNGWTISIVVRAAEKHQVFDLGSVISRLPGHMGKPLQIMTNLMVWFSMFLCLVSYMIVIHDSALKFVKGTVFENRALLVGIASVCVLPLCFFSQRLLEKTSSIAIAVNVYLFILIGVLYGTAVSEDTLPSGCCLVGKTIDGNFAMVSVMFQAVIIQMCVLPMYEELEDRTPAKMDRIIAVGFGALFFIFCGFSIVGYLLIGPDVQSNILADLPNNIGSKIAQIGVIFVVACVYPIMVYPMIAPINSSSGPVTFRGGPISFSIGRANLVVVAKLLIVGSAFVVSVFVSSLGEVNVINGALSAGIFVALLPSLFGWLMLDPTPCKKVSYCLLLVVGFTAAVMGLIYNENYVSDLTCVVSIKR